MSDTIKVDVKGLDEYAKRLEKAGSSIDELLEAVVKDIAKKFITSVAKKTPVDTGNLRRNWTVGEINGKGATVSIDVINPTEYAIYVEYGHRTRGGGWVPGKYMMTVAINEVGQNSQAIVERKIRKFLKEVLG